MRRTLSASVMVASLGLCLSIARAQPTEPAVGSEWRTALGGSVDKTPHGVYELGWRRGPASVTFNTDTLDLRWSPDVEGGRWWVALRGEVGGAGLLFSPWRAGGPPERRRLRAGRRDGLQRHRRREPRRL